MTKEEKKILKEKILAYINNIDNEIEAIKPKLYPIKKDCSIDKVEHKALKIEQNIAMHQFDELKKRKNRLIHALHKIENNPNYGVCQECEENIAFDRLKLIPEAIYCVECQNELNKK